MLNDPHTPYHVLDNFLSRHDYRALQALIKQSYAEGHLQTATVGQTRQKITTLRNDTIHWLDEHAEEQPVQAYFQAMEHMRVQLNQTFYLGLLHYEAHFAVYPAGHFYQKHIDRFVNTQDRRMSCVYYLNDQWEDAWGGHLQMYTLDDAFLAKITPQGNRLVLFDSQLPHEVQITQRTRYSIAGWFKVRHTAPDVRCMNHEHAASATSSSCV